MRTDTDLLEVFTQIANETPDVDVAVTERPRRSRTRLVAVAAAAAVVVAGTAVGIGVTHRNNVTAGSPTTVRAEWAYDLHLDLPSGWTWDQRRLLRGGVMVANVGHPATGSDGVPCTLTVGLGDGSPTRLVDASPTRVGDLPAKIGKPPFPSITAEGGANSARQRLVQWNPVAGRWAESECGEDSSEGDAARQLGAALTLSPSSFVAPFTYTTLPLGLQLNDANSQTSLSGTAPRIYGDLISGVGPTAQPTGLLPKTSDHSIFLALDKTVSQAFPFRAGKRLADIQGHQAWLTSIPSEQYMVLNIVDGDEVLTLSSTNLDGDQLVEVADSLEFASDLADVSTWYESSSFGRSR